MAAQQPRQSSLRPLQYGAHAQARRRHSGGTWSLLESRARHPWVSRGGVKLKAALDAFGLDPHGLDCLDIGASTGGFTDVLLSRGAARVYAVDVGHNQLDARLRNSSQV